MFEPGQHRTRRTGSGVRVLSLLGPAFVASVAYVDPGNIAANLSAGANFGYALVWVLVLASLMAMFIQYQSAKLGLVSGLTLPAAISTRFARHPRQRALTRAYGAQAFVVAIATDLAEVVGGALGLYLLFGMPLWLGSIVIGVVAIGMLWVLRSGSERLFEAGVTALLLVVAAGFLWALFFRPPDWTATAAGLLPLVPDREAWPLVAAMLGATVMPHAIYLHSALAIDRHRPSGRLDQPLRHLLRVQKFDVGLALLLAGSVNVAMLLLGAVHLRSDPADPIVAAHEILALDLGAVAAGVFAIALIASGLSSAIVGTHAGSRILKDLAVWQLAPTWRRGLTIAPAVLLLLTGIPATAVLIWSQVVLSFGIALAAAPLAIATADPRLMGEHADRRGVKILNAVIVSAVIALNLVMIWWAVTGG